MNITIAIAVGCMFGTGITLMSRARAAQLAVGVVLTTNSVILFLVVCGLGGKNAPIAPFDRYTADPLVQAMALTAVVIGCATAVFFFRLIVETIRVENGDEPSGASRGLVSMDEER